jgi:hypothetical protein
VKTALALPIALAVLVVSTAAAADDKAACLAASSQGQTLRNAHQLLEAREQFRICSGQQCPGVVQHDCEDWLGEIDKSIPTVVLAAKDGSGHDLFDVTVTVDGKVIAKKLDGQALPLDPGPHTFRFDLADGTSATQQVLVREGDKLHDVSVVLQAGATTPAASSSPATPSSQPTDAGTAKPAGSDRGSTQRVIGYVLIGVGVVGLGVGAGLGFVAKSSDNTAEAETGSARYTDSGNAVSQGNVATGVFVAGAVAAAAGVVVWLTAPSAKVTVGTNGREVFLGGRF